MYGNVKGSQYLTPRKNTDAFALIVSELAGHYINLQVIQKFTQLLPPNPHMDNNWPVRLKHKHNTTVSQCYVTQYSKCGNDASGMLDSFLSVPEAG